MPAFCEKKITWIIKIMPMLMLIFSYSFLSAQKTDTVILINGNIITGEIKKFKYGIMDYKMDGLGTATIEVDRISSMMTDKIFEIRMKNGFIYFGSLDTSNVPRQTYINVLNDRVPVSMENIMEMYRIRDKFWSRIDGNADLGFNYTKGSNILQFNFSGTANYRSRKYYGQLATTIIYSNPKQENETRKFDFTISVQRHIKKKWYVYMASVAETNSELGLDLRILLSAGGSYRLVQNMRQSLFTTLGANVNREWANGADTATNNLEGMLFTQYKIFRFLIPKLDITTQLAFFPSFTVRERYRLNLSISARLELISDFYINLSFYDNFDSKPSSETASTNDWGTVISIGVTF